MDPYAHLPDWRDASAYTGLRTLPRAAFAWEWLRRFEPYLAAWHDAGRDRSSREARTFGLVAFEDPTLSAEQARPMWSAHVDPAVLVARIVPDLAQRADLIDLLDVRPLVAAIVDGRDIEHVLFSDGHHALRVDVAGGTLVGTPAMLAYRLVGVARARHPLRSLRRLLALLSDRRFASTLDPPETRAERWILELRVADALRTGASQQDIARVLFERMVADTQWRLATPAARSRVQRLVRAARLRCGAHPVADWFGSDADPMF